MIDTITSNRSTNRALNCRNKKRHASSRPQKIYNDKTISKSLKNKNTTLSSSIPTTSFSCCRFASRRYPTSFSRCRSITGRYPFTNSRFIRSFCFPCPCWVGHLRKLVLPLLRWSSFECMDVDFFRFIHSWWFEPRTRPVNMWELFPWRYHDSDISRVERVISLTFYIKILIITIRSHLKLFLVDFKQNYETRVTRTYNRALHEKMR